MEITEELETYSNKNIIYDSKKLYYLDGLGEGVYEYSIEKLGSYGEEEFYKLVLYKYEEYNSNSLIDYFQVEYTYNINFGVVELTTKYTLENIYGQSERDLTFRIVYSESSDENIHKEISSKEDSKLPYILSFNSKLVMCLPKVLEQIHMKKLNFIVRKKKVYIY